MLRNSSRILLIILFIFGAGLIYLSFSLLTAGAPFLTVRHWLTLAVIYVNYILLFVQIPLLAGSQNTFSERIPSVSISLIAQILYGVFSIAFLVLAYFLGISFRWQLIGQGVLFFLLLVNIFSSVLAGEKVNEVASQEKVLLYNLQNAKQELNRLLLAFKQKEFLNVYFVQLEKASEVLKYISGVDAPAAQKIDTEIYELISQLHKLVSTMRDKNSFEVSEVELTQGIEMLVTKIQERKTYRN